MGFEYDQKLFQAKQKAITLYTTVYNIWRKYCRKSNETFLTADIFT